MVRTSKRQKRLYGIRPGAFPQYLRDEMAIDETYRAALAKDPAAARWLSAFNEETLKGVRIKGECHVLTKEQHLEADRNRQRRRRNRDALEFAADRGRLRNASDGSTEDRIIEQIDTERAIALRSDYGTD